MPAPGEHKTVQARIGKSELNPNKHPQTPTFSHYKWYPYWGQITPDFTHRWNARGTELLLPNFSGRSFRFTPLSSTKNIPSMALRLSLRGRSLLGFRDQAATTDQSFSPLPQSVATSATLNISTLFRKDGFGIASKNTDDPMERKFHQFPENEPAVIDDDGVAQTIMLELGCWDEIAKLSDSSKNLSICVADSHPTHWCLCAKHANNPDPRENGFQVIAYPKSSVDRLAVELLMQNYLKNSTELSVALFEPKPLDP